MSLHRYPDKRDANEPALMATAARLGAEFRKTPPFDGVIAYRGKLRHVEVKDPARQGSAREYTPMQKTWLAFFQRHGIKLLVWRTDDDVIRDLGREFT